MFGFSRRRTKLGRLKVQLSEGTRSPVHVRHPKRIANSILNGDGGEEDVDAVTGSSGHSHEIDNEIENVSADICSSTSGGSENWYAAAVIGNKIIVVGGESATGLLDDVQVLNFDTFSWTTASSKLYLSPSSLPLKIPACRGHSLALYLHNKELLNRRIKVEIAREKREYPPYRSLSSSFHTGGNLHSHTSKGFDSSLLENKPKSPSTPKETKGTSKTVYVGNLSYTVERADVEKLFKDYGEIVDVRLYTDREGKFIGRGHVQFATEEAAHKALALKNKIFFKSSMIVDLAFERRKYSPNGSWAWSDSFHKDERFQSQTVPVKCLDTSLAEGKCR